MWILEQVKKAIAFVYGKSMSRREEKNKLIAELEAAYSGLDITGDLAKNYVWPYFLRRKSIVESDSDADARGGRALSKSVLDELVSISKGQSTSRQVVIVADAGMGKTSLLSMLALRCLSRTFRRRFTPVIYRASGQFLAQFERTKEGLSKDHSVLFIDALDEYTAIYKGSTSEFLDSILDKTKDFITIVACRDTYLNKNINHNRVYSFYHPHIFKIDMFDGSLVNKYLNKRLGFIDFSTKLKIKSIMDSVDDWEVAFRPLILKEICGIFEYGGRAALEGLSNLDSVCGIYAKIVESWIRREYDKGVHRGSFSDVFDEYYRISIVVAKCIHSASSKRSFEVAMEEANLEYLDKRSLIRTNKGAASFIHKSFGEYFIAYTIRYDLSPGSLMVRLNRNVLTFICEFENVEGVLSHDKILPNYHVTEISTVFDSDICDPFAIINVSFYNVLFVDEKSCLFVRCKFVRCFFYSVSRDKFEGCDFVECLFALSGISLLKFESCSIDSSSLFSFPLGEERATVLINGHRTILKDAKFYKMSRNGDFESAVFPDLSVVGGTWRKEKKILANSMPKIGRRSPGSARG